MGSTLEQIFPGFDITHAVLSKAGQDVDYFSFSSPLFTGLEVELYQYTITILMLDRASV